MIITPLALTSAVNFWLDDTNQNFKDAFSLESRHLVDLPGNFELSINNRIADDLASMYGLSFPITLMSPSNKYRPRSLLYECVGKTENFPNRSFIEINSYDMTWIAIPELCFLQMAKRLSFHEAVLLANNLCAIYVYDLNSSYYQRNRLPITTTETISEYLNKAKKYYGVNDAKDVIRYAVNRSNSPMESKIAVLLSLPLHKGGFSLPKFKMNHPIKISDKAAILLGRDTICCDIVWEEEQFALEYDSNLSHLTADQHAYDKHRSTALSMSGYKIFSLTADMLSNFQNIDNTFYMIRKELGLKSRQARFEQYRKIRWQVIHDLFRKKEFFYSHFNHS